MLEPLFGELKDGIILSDPDGEVLYMNDAAARKLGRDPGAGGGLTCDLVCARLEADGVGPDCSASCPVRRRSARMTTFQGRYGPRPRYSWSEEGWQPQEPFVELRVHCQRLQTPLFDSWAFEKLLTTIEDIGAERELERHKEDWRNMVAHDLRAPMTSIFGTLRLLQESPARVGLTLEESRLMAAAVRSSHRLLALLDLYLDVAKLDAGLMRCRAEPVAVGELLASCVEELRASAGERGLTVEVDAPAGVVASADPELLFRVVQNLLANAVKFAKQNGRVTLSARCAGPAVEVSVSDDGPGIAATDLKRLFDRFYQAEARRGGKLRGTGLGLTFCREALRAMKGAIRVESTPGRGATFTATLPAAARA